MPHSHVDTGRGGDAGPWTVFLDVNDLAQHCDQQPPSREQEEKKEEREGKREEGGKESMLFL